MEGSKAYDLEGRSRKFASEVRELIKRLPRTIGNLEDGKQLVRSSGSVGANYIEAAEALGTKDFTMHMRISRKEARESKHWLSLLDTGIDNALHEERNRLLQEADELTRIFNKIVRDRQP